MDEYFSLPPAGPEHSELLPLDGEDPIVAAAEAARRVLPDLSPTFSHRAEGPYEPSEPQVQRYSEPHEIHVRDRRIEELEHEKRLNPLTGLPNRLAFDEELQSRITKEVKFSVGVLDLTNFKYINDRYGHKRGDDVIRAAGGLMRDIIKHTRRTDFLAHLSGDEFAIILDMQEYENDKLTPEQRSEGIQRRLKEVVADYAKTSELDKLGFDIAMGIVVHVPGMTGHETFEAADTEMYKHKQRQHDEKGSYR